MEPRISIIVPGYKVEQYVAKCLQSLVNQTLHEIEIIVVNDGSPDNSLSICERFAAADPRVKVYSKQNGGLSDARNYGIAKATAPYIGFVDSDDYVDETMFAYLLSLIEHHHADIAVCGVKQFNEKGVYSTRGLEKETVMNKHDALRELFFGQNIMNAVCNKLFRREMLSGIEFPFGKLYEDEFYTYRAFDQAATVVAGSGAFYYYNKKNAGSITSGSFTDRELDRVEASLQKIEYCDKKYPSLISLVEQYLVYDCLVCLSKMEKYDKKYDGVLKCNIRSHLLSYLRGKTSITGKCFAVAAAVSPQLAVYLYKKLPRHE